MKFNDLTTGTVITHGPASLSEDEITTFAKDWDPQWFHTDPDAARNGRFGGLIGSGWQTCALAMRMACEAVLEGSESYASPGIAYIKWPSPVRPGEPLTWRAEVLEQRRARSQPTLGILRWRWEMLHTDGRVALELEATSLFDLADTPVAPA
jgi:acyl dehydratase